MMTDRSIRIAIRQRPPMRTADSSAMRQRRDGRWLCCTAAMVCSHSATVHRTRNAAAPRCIASRKPLARRDGRDGCYAAARHAKAPGCNWPRTGARRRMVRRAYTQCGPVGITADEMRSANAGVACCAFDGASPALAGAWLRVNAAVTLRCMEDRGCCVPDARVVSSCSSRAACCNDARRLLSVGLSAGRCIVALDSLGRRFAARHSSPAPKHSRSPAACQCEASKQTNACRAPTTHEECEGSTCTQRAFRAVPLRTLPLSRAPT